MSKLDDFLAHHIEGYLFYDIGFLERDDESGGGVGYPMLMTCCAGIECLGALRSRQPFSAYGQGHLYFADYWQSCLYPAPSPFNDFHKQTYQLVRHGIAHTFITKGKIGVVRKHPSLHFTHNNNGQLLIDAVQLGRDLIASYTRFVKPILSDAIRSPEKQRMETRLGEMESEFDAQARKHGLGYTISSSIGPSGLAAPITQSVDSPSKGTV